MFFNESFWRRLGLILISAYLIVPTVFVVWLSFSTDDVLRFPPNLFSLQWYVKFITDPQWNEALLRTIVVGFLSTIFAVVAGTTAAFAVARSQIPAARLIEMIAITPLVVPPIVIATGGYALYLEMNLIGSNFGLSVMHAVLGVPYVYLIVYAAFTRTDPNIEMAAVSLGANRWQTVRDVTFPIILPSMITGGLFAFLVSFDEVIVTIFLSGSLASTLPVRIFSSLSFAVSPVVAAVSTLQLIVAMGLLIQLGLIRRWQESRIQTRNSQD